MTIGDAAASRNRAHALPGRVAQPFTLAAMRMPEIGFHASHEQFSPRDLLAWVQAAERAGFDQAMCSDHFHPWSERQGQSGFSFAWLGAALQATGLSFGVVTAPGYRYHPAVVAQAAATLAQMYPGRFWMAPGSGEYLNEHVTGEPWPVKAERKARLLECVEVMRALWRGEEVTHRGRVVVQEARLYTLPEEPPALIAPALTPETARWAAAWADGLITINLPDGKHAEVIRAFREAGGDGKPICLQVHVSWAATQEEAERSAHDQWRSNLFADAVSQDLAMPRHFDAASRFVRPEDLSGHVRISAELRRHVDWIVEDAALGCTRVYLHNVGRNQAEFIEAFGAEVLPAVRG